MNSLPLRVGEGPAPIRAWEGEGVSLKVTRSAASAVTLTRC